MSDKKEYDYFFRIILVGEASVGKSSIVETFLNDNCKDFQLEYRPTIGVDFMNRTIIIDKKRVKLQLWNLSGDKKYRSLSFPCFTNFDAAIIVYDVTNLESYTEVSTWSSELYRYRIKEGACIMLVGNKYDLNSKRSVLTQEAKIKAEYNKWDFIECSAKHNVNIRTIFERLSQNLIKKEGEGQQTKAWQSKEGIAPSEAYPAKRDCVIL